MLAQQQQHQQMQQMQQQHLQGGSNFGMSGPGNNAGAPFGGGISAPSPTNSQSWNAPTQGGYPFAPSPSTSDHPRHMSATPAPQQQPPHITPQNTPPADQSMMPNEFDIFNWNT
ncbi:hypothetical protein BDN70DRAFT_877864 [Pholiota conissans]|uniref:Uncharacterized protein n=1 Tax=Pholiota conissans TaxID=109636 RepID=A0A9P5Z2I4_9AGAR|nr:hypothetical protein BDN70DRAFT_877864 [Pholiota conissans]